MWWIIQKPVYSRSCANIWAGFMVLSIVFQQFWMPVLKSNILCEIPHWHCFDCWWQLIVYQKVWISWCSVVLHFLLTDFDIPYRFSQFQPANTSLSRLRSSLIVSTILFNKLENDLSQSYYLHLLIADQSHSETESHHCQFLKFDFLRSFASLKTNMETNLRNKYTEMPLLSY